MMLINFIPKNIFAVDYVLGTFNGLPAYVSNTGDLVLCKENFPDDTLRAYIIDRLYLTGENPSISLANLEASKAKILYIGSKNITSLKGIEYLPMLERLSCENNLLTEVDLSHNPKLIYLSIHNNQLSELDLSHNPNLTSIDCDSMPNITSLDVGNMPNLDRLSCSYMGISTLDLSKNTKLTYLNCGHNMITTLDLTNNTELKELYCVGENYTNSGEWNDDGLESLDITGLTKLEIIDCSLNSLMSIDLSTNIKYNPNDDYDQTKLSYQCGPLFYAIQNKDLDWIVDLNSILPTLKQRQGVIKAGEGYADYAADTTYTFDAETGLLNLGKTKPESNVRTYFYDSGNQGIQYPMTVYIWVDPTHNVKFESNGGSQVENQVVKEDELASKPKDPTKNSSVFEGWYTDAELTTPYDFATPVKDDITLYAKWKAIPATADNNQSWIYLSSLTIVSFGIVLLMKNKHGTNSKSNKF